MTWHVEIGSGHHVVNVDNSNYASRPGWTAGQLQDESSVIRPTDSEESHDKICRPLALCSCCSDLCSGRTSVGYVALCCRGRPAAGCRARHRSEERRVGEE